MIGQINLLFGLSLPLSRVHCKPSHSLRLTYLFNLSVSVLFLPSWRFCFRHFPLAVLVRGVRVAFILSTINDTEGSCFSNLDQVPFDGFIYLELKQTLIFFFIMFSLSGIP